MNKFKYIHKTNPEINGIVDADTKHKMEQDVNLRPFYRFELIPQEQPQVEPVIAPPEKSKRKRKVTTTKK